MNPIDLYLTNNPNYNKYIERKEYYNDILQKYTGMAQDSVNINYLNLCIMLISRHTDDYNSIMMALNNAMEFEIDGTRPTDISLYADSCYDMNCLLKSPDVMCAQDEFMFDEFKKFKNNISRSLNQETWFGISLTFKTTRRVIEFHNDNNNNDVLTNHYIDRFIKYCDDDRDIVIRDRKNTISYDVGYSDMFPLRFSFNYFVGG